MNRRFVLLFVVAAFVALIPFRSPAPLIYTPGEGWYYEPAGEKADWMRPRAKEQDVYKRQVGGNGLWRFA